MGLATLPGDPLGLAKVHDMDTPCATCHCPMSAHWRLNPKCSECPCARWVCSEQH